MGTLAGESFLFPSFFSLFPLFSFFPSDGSFETSCWVGTEGGGEKPGGDGEDGGGLDRFQTTLVESFFSFLFSFFITHVLFFFSFSFSFLPSFSRVKT